MESQCLKFSLGRINKVKDLLEVNKEIGSQKRQVFKNKRSEM
jgi:hypothetical protein